MPIKTKRVYELSSPDDGTRILVMRFYPRGVRREHFHEWYKELGTSPELIKKRKAGRITWEKFANLYENQIIANPQARATLDELAQRAKHETITLLCTCMDEAHCHRTLLKMMIEQRMKSR